MSDQESFYDALCPIVPLSQDSIWLTSTLSCSRNISSFKFLDSLETQQKQNIIEIFTNAFTQIPIFKNCSIKKASAITPLNRELIAEKFFLTWPIDNLQDQAFFVDSVNSLFVGINFSDHLLLYLITSSQDIENSWKQLITLDNDIHKQVNYAFSEDFGFLTVDPKQCGTAFTLSIYLHTPAIFWNKALCDLLEDDNIKFYGLGNQQQEFLGDILILRNTKTLGISEENILSSLRIWCHKIMGLENKLRKQLLSQNNKKLLDLIIRSLGLLTHSYELSLEESLKAISLIKLGIDLNIIEKPNLNLNDIILHLHRSHLIFSSNNHNKILSKEEVLILRSEVIKPLAEKLSLVK